MRKHTLMAALTLGVAMTASIATGAARAAEPAAVVKHYADMALAKYEDALAGAQALQSKVDALLAAPSAQTLQDARRAWIDARAPYMQTEVYRFGNPIVDDWEPRVNAWPLDEGMIDYVDASYGTESDTNAYYVP